MSSDFLLDLSTIKPVKSIFNPILEKNKKKSEPVHKTENCSNEEFWRYECFFFCYFTSEPELFAFKPDHRSEIDNKITESVIHNIEPVIVKSNRNS